MIKYHDKNNMILIGRSGKYHKAKYFTISEQTYGIVIYHKLVMIIPFTDFEQRDLLRCNGTHVFGEYYCNGLASRTNHSSNK